jgi:transposase InsO family protein
MMQFIQEKSLGVSVRTMWRWLGAERPAMAKKRPSTGRRKLDWPEEAKELLQAKWLSVNKPTMRSCISIVRAVARKEEWCLPSDRTMERFLSGIDRAVQTKFRKGTRAYTEKCLPYAKRDWERREEGTALEVGELWVGDHKQIDVAVCDVDGELGKAGDIFFPWCTAWMDARSRRIVGWHLDKTPSGITIKAAFADAIERCENVPAEVYVDNGRDYSGRELSGRQRRFRVSGYKTDEEVAGLFAMLGVKATFAIPHSSWSKHIERAFKEFDVDHSRHLSGYRGNSPENRPEGVDEAIKAGKVLSLTDYRESLKTWLDNVYHSRPHEGLGGMAIMQVWNEGFKTPKRIARDALAWAMMPEYITKVTRNGVRIYYNDYWCEELAPYRGQEVRVKYSPLPGGLAEVHIFQTTARCNYIGLAIKRNAIGAMDKDGARQIAREKALRKRADKIKFDRVRDMKKRTAHIDGATVRDIDPIAPVRPEGVPTVLVHTPFDGMDEKAQRKRKRMTGADEIVSFPIVAESQDDKEGRAQFFETLLSTATKRGEA